MEASSTAEPTPSSEPAEGLLCPRCGYDLRGAVSDRCSECGLEINREALRESGFPWAHRKQLGTIRAFWKTVFFVTFGSKRLRHEMAKPQDQHAANAFRWWVAGCLSLALVVPLTLYLVFQGVEDLALSKRTDWKGNPVPAYMLDLRVPWSAAVVFWPILPLCTIGFACYVTGTSRPIFRLRGFPADHQYRTRAVATYALAPLALLAPAVALAFGLGFAGKYLDEMKAAGLVIIIVWGVGIAALSGASVLMSLLQTGIWRARASHAGTGTALLAVGELLVRWCVGAVVFLWFIPWCAGLTWIVIDSFQ